MNRKVPNFFSGLLKLGVTALLISCWTKDFSEARLLFSPCEAPEKALNDVLSSIQHRWRLGSTGRLDVWMWI